MNARTKTTAIKASFVALVATAAVLPGSAAMAHHDHGGSYGDTGAIVICNHSGYGYGIYADGPSAEQTDLAGSFDECERWDVLPGAYELGMTAYAPGSDPLLFQARFKRNGHSIYKVFNGEGTINFNVAEGKTTRVDLFVPQG